MKLIVLEIFGFDSVRSFLLSVSVVFIRLVRAVRSLWVMRVSIFFCLVWFIVR